MEENNKYHKDISEDFSLMHNRFVERRSTSYDFFKSLWKELSFDYLFGGRNDEKECREFAEECLKVALEYCNRSYIPCVRTMGLYLCYAIYHTYPYELKVKIRLNLEEWKELTYFIKDIENQISCGTSSNAATQTQELLDVIYIFEQLRKDRCFCIAATKSEVHPVSRQAAEHEMENERIEELLTRPRVISKIFDINTIDELSAMTAEYDLQKEKLKERYPEIEKSLSITTGDVVQKITKLIASHEEWKKTYRLSKRGESKLLDNDTDNEVETSKAPEVSGDDLAERRKSIKRKAINQSPNSSKKTRKGHKSGTDSEDATVEREITTTTTKKKRSKMPANKRKWKVEEDDTANEPPLKSDCENLGECNNTLSELEHLLT